MGGDNEHSEAQAVWGDDRNWLGRSQLFSPFLIPRAVLAFGFSFFFCWTALCVASVLADRLLVWAILSCSALLMVSVDWWLKGPPPINEYGYGPLDAIILFAATALVVGGTGALSVIRTAVGTQRSTR